MTVRSAATPWAQGLALAVGGVVVVEVAATAVLTFVVGWSWRQALEAFTATNAAMGVSFAVCGSVIAWHRPRNPVGWLFAAPSPTGYHREQVVAGRVLRRAAKMAD